MNKEFILEVENLSIQRGGKNILENISFSLHPGDHLAVTGASGSGKTTLAEALAGKLFYKGIIRFGEESGRRIIYVEQQHHFKNRSNTTDLYYQQRFNAYDAEETQTVKDTLAEAGQNADAVLRILQIEYLADKPLIQLSNGENKKLQLARALLLQPSVLIMDQPFIGLDTDARKYLHALIGRLASDGIMIIIVTGSDEIPGCITQVLELEKGKQKAFQTVQDFKYHHPGQYSPLKRQLQPLQHERLTHQSAGNEFRIAVGMHRVNIRYGEKQILRDINWEVKNGERWLLSGHNGAGKSTLLSLVTGDNPQAYANEIYLFDKKRGTGESIWDIKKKIGYLSPELHLFFDQSSTSFEAIASGLFDTIGLFRQLSDNNIQDVNAWMAIAGIEQLGQKRLFELSAGEQRLVLLARALVKNPPLLILDEPCQGLDKEQEAAILELVDEVCVRGNKTLVFVTHYANARPVCVDKFLKLENGTVVSLR